MSRFTRPPFHKPSPFDIPRPVHPLSPPETDITADSIPLPPMSIVSRLDRDIGPGSFVDLNPSSSFTRVDTPESHHPTVAAADTPQSSSYTQTQNGRFRPRAPILGYVHHPGTVRNDVRTAPRSATRWLVMVIPPPAVAREHGNGVFLNASSHSLQGVLLPLLPSLSGQLTAIAREFAFPSTTGICIYLQMSDGGIQFAPRISDESWSILWGAAFDERQSVQTMGGLPIAGRIEFDLDLRKARWFDMWLTSVKRNSVDTSSSIGVPGSHDPNHRREESRTTTFETAEDSVNEDVSATIQRRVPVVRHVPRKLSLLDRVDVSSIKPSPKPASQIAGSPTDAGQRQPRISLSPVVQTPIAVVPAQVAVEDYSSDEPRTATVVRRADVERKVENWRASSSFSKSPLIATTGQTALDPANMPNNHPLVEIEGDELEPLNLDDFTWSISSAGPLSADYCGDIPLFDDTDRPPSVHLDARLEGSVCLTPTTCTSWGPPDYDYSSVVESFIDRLPSPDIAARQYEDAPSTPLTATSWGPLSEYPDSPASLFRAPSIDIAARELGSRPATPSTATSWGPPLEWPDSPAERFCVLSPDLAARQLESRPATPSTATSWGPPLEWPASPATPFRVETPGVGSMFFDGMDEEDALLEKGRALFAAAAASDDKPLGLLLGNEGVSKPWEFVWPYRRTASMELQKPSSVRIQPKYPCISLYTAVYPHFDLYPTQAACHIVNEEQPNQRGGELRSSEEPAPIPVAKPWKHVWPYQKIAENISSPVNVRVKAAYPSFDLYPAVYPYFDLYPANPLLDTLNRQVNAQLEPKYPFFSIYPAVYPNFEIYPGHIIEAQKNPQELIETRLEAKYPCIQPYPAVYPYFELYPTVPPKSSAEVTEKRQPPRKGDTPVYVEEPRVRKASPWKHVWPYQHIESGPRPVEMQLKSKYPFFDLYPPVYPHFDLYPEQLLAVRVTKEVGLKLETKYPAFSIYPAVYPNFEIYPGHVVDAQNDPRGRLSVKLRPSYPVIEIYSPVYPHLVIYPEVKIRVRDQPMTMSTASHTAGSVASKEAASQQVATKLPASSTLAIAYPNLDIYPAVYPYFDIYRSGKASTPNVLGPARVSLNAKYPVLEIYPPVYPYFDIYKSGQVFDPRPLVVELATKLEAKYPAFDIYPAVYPNFDIYPSVDPAMHSSIPVPVSRRRPRKTHRDLINEVLANKPQAPSVPRISITFHETRLQRRKRTHADLVEQVFPKHMRKQEDVTPYPRVRRSANVPRDIKETAAAVAAATTVASGSNSASPTSRTGVSRLPSGIPVRPHEIRRSVSLREGTMSSSQGVSRSHSVRQLPSVREEASGNRTSFLDLDRQRRSPPSVLVGERKLLKRDSIVLEKARHWGSTTTESKSVPRPLDSVHSRVSLKDLSEFPMPPLPPVPSLPNSTVPVATTSPSTQKPVSKLDRTRFPFR